MGRIPTYKQAHKMNAVFLLLLFSTNSATSQQGHKAPDTQNSEQGKGRALEYFEEKMREFERDKYRF
jgi:hypothetical protein